MRSAFLVLALVALPAAADDSPIKWKKTIVDRKFTSEGVAIADVNQDGKMDVLTGEIWYEAPDWKPHRIRPGKDDYTVGQENKYSESFSCWTDDFNGDGWPDLLVVGFPGKPCHWFENPRGKDGMWTAHVVWHSACNETPLYVDLLGTGKRGLVMGFQPEGKENEGQMAYFVPAKDPNALWEMKPISEPSVPPQVKNGKAVPGTGNIIPGTFKYAHGLGVGDLNGDGKLDVLCPAGWWEQPARDEGKPWIFHKTSLGDACADMFAFDIDGDGKADVLSSSAHNYGIWAHLRKSDSSFVKKDLFPKLVSQTHALHFVDINGDGLKDLVTGKRKWAHGPKGDADPGLPPKLYWLEARKAADGTFSFIPREIDDDSGIGTQFTVADFNGDKRPDIIVANKNGVFILEQAK
jgi:hypothetical protein